MAKKLEDLDWSPKWVSHMGCIKGCLDHMGVGASDAWVYGASGHAFIINVHDVVSVRSDRVELTWDGETRREPWMQGRERLIP